MVIFSESKFYAVYNGENHFQIRGLVAELHGFEYGDTTSSTFEKLTLNVEDFYVKTIGWGLFLRYRLNINDFLSSYNQYLKIDNLTPLQQIPFYCNLDLAH